MNKMLAQLEGNAEEYGCKPFIPSIFRTPLFSSHIILTNAKQSSAPQHTLKPPRAKPATNP